VKQVTELVGIGYSASAVLLLESVQLGKPCVRKRKKKKRKAKKKKKNPENKAELLFWNGLIGCDILKRCGSTPCSCWYSYNKVGLIA